MPRIEVVDDNGVVIAQSPKTDSWGIVYEQDGKLKAQGSFAISTLLTAAMPHMGKVMAMFGKKG